MIMNCVCIWSISSHIHINYCKQGFIMKISFCNRCTMNYFYRRLPFAAGDFATVGKSYLNLRKERTVEHPIQRAYLTLYAWLSRKECSGMLFSWGRYICKIFLVFPKFFTKKWCFTSKVPNVIQPVGTAVSVAPWKKEELSIGEVCTGKAMETHFYSTIFFFFH